MRRTGFPCPVRNLSVSDAQCSPNPGMQQPGGGTWALEGWPELCCCSSADGLQPPFPLPRCCRLGSEANLLSSQQRDIAVQHVTHKRAKDAHALVQQRVAHFRHACSDTLTTGLVVMVAVAVRQAVHGRGATSTAAAQFARCGR